MSDIVRLTPYEINLAAQIGVMRTTEDFRFDFKWGHNYSRSMYYQFADSISGALCEFAVAQYLKVPPQIHCNVGNRPDLEINGAKIQIKSQIPKYNQEPKFYIRQNAKDEDLFCFCIERCPEIEIVGFIFAKDIIHDESRLTNFGYNDRPPVYQLYQHELKALKNILT